MLQKHSKNVLYSSLTCKLWVWTPTSKGHVILGATREFYSTDIRGLCPFLICTRPRLANEWASGNAQSHYFTAKCLWNVTWRGVAQCQQALTVWIIYCRERTREISRWQQLKQTISSLCWRVFLHDFVSMSVHAATQVPPSTVTPSSSSF